MKVWLKCTVVLVLAAASCAGTSAVRHFEMLRRAEIPCTGISVNLSKGAKLIGPADVERHLARTCGEFLNVPLPGLDLALMEERLSRHEMVKSCEVWTTDDGTLHVSVRQKVPALRFENNAEGFYCDAEGGVFPLVNGWTADVPVVSGLISEALDSAYRVEAVRIVDQTLKDRNWLGRIDGYRALPGGHFGLALAGSGTLVDLGPIGKAGSRLGAALEYCTVIAPRKRYSFVSVDFKGQIICKENI